MLMQAEDKILISRRSAIRGGTALAVSGGLAMSSAKAIAGSVLRPTSRPKNPRVVVIQTAPGDNSKAFSLGRAMDWVAAKAGSVDLIAFHVVAQTISDKELGAICERTRDQSCYVSLGVTMDGSSSVPVLVGPDGRVVGHEQTNLNSSVHHTDFGVVALTSNTQSTFDSVPSNVDVVIQSARHNPVHDRGGFYLISLEAQDGRGGSGSAVYAPDGAAMTCTGAGWTQGIIATLDVVGLRRNKEQECQV